MLWLFCQSGSVSAAPSVSDSSFSQSLHSGPFSWTDGHGSGVTPYPEQLGHVALQAIDHFIQPNYHCFQIKKIKIISNFPCALLQDSPTINTFHNIVQLLKPES